MAYVINREEVNEMPCMDGTGPRGMGARTGLGLGMCRSTDARFGGFGYGCGLGRGLGRSMGFCRFAGEREALASLRAALQTRLAGIERRLQEM